ncbi:agamous-like MADS-box protein AGL80 [Impatiens glandulifera]|uniref:agamous-like MADS-box protein AGL80 n=1 Tax=Impatiens glandulifera TaxID=253017 RepID=UPI001FB09D8E|nr:agamous-like MADS-box protein AGL80 [Impatiens glandulifera]
MVSTIAEKNDGVMKIHLFPNGPVASQCCLLIWGTPYVLASKRNTVTRKKVNLTYILNNSARRNTYKKRKLSVVKQLDEITTLCDVEVCTVIYSDFDPQPVVWPSMDEVRRLITKYQSFPKVDQGKRKVNQETFTRQRLQKIQEKLRRQERENHHNEMTRIMFQSMMNPQHAMSGLNTEEDFKELARVISQNMMEVNRMMAPPLSILQLMGDLALAWRPT